MLSLSRIGLIILIAILPQMAAPPAAAEWPPGGIAICSALGTQRNPEIIADGAGGAIVAWEDERSGDWDIYIQRIDHDGNALWQADGVPVCAAPGDDVEFRIASDGAGGAFVAWLNGSQTHLQRVDHLGAAVGPSGGISMGPNRVAALVADGEGGVIFARAYTRIVVIYPGPREQIWCAILAQRLNALLVRQWGVDDAGIYDTLEWADAALASDGAGGAFVAYIGAFEDPRIVRIDSQGDFPWGARGGIPGIAIVPDGAGGAIVGSTTLQRVDPSGAFLWGASGIATGLAGGLISDGAGGAIVGSSIVQRVDSAGALVWGPGGVATEATGEIISDGAGGAIVGSTSLQRVSPAGLLLYRPGGIATGATASAKLAPNGDHGAYLAWGAAGALDQDIFIQRIPHACEPVLSPIGDRNADAGSELAIDLSASSGALDDTLVYWTNADSILQSLFSFNELTGEFRWTPVPGDAGEHRVTFGVWGKCGEDHESITILVRLNGNLPPKLDPIAPVSAYEGWPVVIEAHASDPDGDALVYSIDDLRFARNGNVFTWRTREGDAGVYHPVIAVTDGVLADSVTVDVEVCGEAPPDSDPMTGPSSGNDWRGNLVAWSASLDGYLRASTPSWNAAVVSGGAVSGADGVFIVRIDHRTGSTNYMLGATDTPADATDYHYSRIDLGIYVNSDGSIRPTWDVDNRDYWNRTLPTGVYDVRVSLDAGSGRVAFAIDDVPAYDAPPAAFSDPRWRAVVTRFVPAACYIQINPYNEFAHVYDVWRPGVAPPPDTGGTVLGSFGVSQASDRVRVQWLLERCSPVARFFVLRAAGDGAYETVPDPAIDRVDLQCTFTDATVVSGNVYRYRVDVTDEDGRKILFETDPVPVGPTVFNGFTVSPSDTAIDVRWQLVSCAPDARFFVLRKEAGGRYAELANAIIERNGLDFSVVDETVVVGTTYYYRVDVEDHDGRRELFETNAVTFTGEPPPIYRLALGQNHPNPFNPGTSISYTLGARGRVAIEIFDVQGRLIRRLVDEIADPGPHEASWNGLDGHGRRVASGVYFYRLTSQGTVLTRKMIVLR